MPPTHEAIEDQNQDDNNSDTSDTSSHIEAMDFLFSSPISLKGTPYTQPLETIVEISPPTHTSLNNDSIHPKSPSDILDSAILTLSKSTLQSKQQERFDDPNYHRSVSQASHSMISSTALKQVIDDVDQRHQARNQELL